MKISVILGIVLLSILVVQVSGKNITQDNFNFNNAFGCPEGDPSCHEVNTTSPSIDFAIPEPGSITTFVISSANQGFTAGGFTIWGSGGLLSQDDKWDFTLYLLNGTAMTGHMETGHIIPGVGYNNLLFNGEWWNSTELIGYQLAVYPYFLTYDDDTLDSWLSFNKGNTEGSHRVLLLPDLAQNPIVRILKAEIHRSIGSFGIRWIL
jgi:hypothetical protein